MTLDIAVWIVAAMQTAHIHYRSMNLREFHLSFSRYYVVSYALQRCDKNTCKMLGTVRKTIWWW